MRFHLAKAFLVVYCLIVFAKLAEGNSYDSIEYNLSLSNIKDSVLQVEMILKGKMKDKLVLDMPFKWAGASYVDQIKNIKIEGNYKVNFIKNDDSSQLVIPMAKNVTDQIKITYEIHQKIGNPSDVHEAIIREDLVHSPGYGIFATPDDLKETDKINVNINWIRLDPKWKTISSYGPSSSESISTTEPKLLHAIYIAGKNRIYKKGDDASPVFLSLYGKFDLDDTKIVSDLAEIIHSQRTFFKDFDFPYYAISLIEGDDPRSMGGTALINSFTAFLPKKMELFDYYILFAHEHFHNWTGGKIRKDKEEELAYWWSEGFTDFYSRLIALRSKGIDSVAFINEMNNFLSTYYLSPVNQEPNSRIKKDFWNDYDIQKLPYHRGFIFAIYLNDMIQKEKPDSSLDNIMQDLFFSKQEFSSALFKDIARKYIKNGIDSEMLNFIDNGNIISLKDVNLPIEKVLMGRYHLGFDRDIFLKDKMIQEIDINSNAYKAGLRNGQKIISFDSPKGKGYPDQIITIETSNGTFNFKPEHDNKIEIYQLRTNMSLKEVKQFNKFFDLK